MRCSKHDLVSCPAEACGAPDETKPSEDCPVTKFFREHPLPGFEVEPFAGGQAWRVVAEALQNYLSSQLCMTMMARLTLYRACGENPRVVVKHALGKDKTVNFRVSIHRSNGEVEHFNRDGKP